MSSCINNTLISVDETLKIVGAFPPLSLGIGFGRTFIFGSLFLGGTTVALITKLYSCCCCIKQTERSIDDIAESRLNKLQDFNAKTLKQTAHGLLEITCLKMPLAIALHQDADVIGQKNDEYDTPAFCQLTEKEVYYEMSNSSISSYQATHIIGYIPGFSLLIGSVRVLTHLGLVFGNICACFYNMIVACRSKDDAASDARDNLDWHAKAIKSNFYGIAIGVIEITHLKGLIAGCWYIAKCRSS